MTASTQRADGQGLYISPSKDSRDVSKFTHTSHPHSGPEGNPWVINVLIACLHQLLSKSNYSIQVTNCKLRICPILAQTLPHNNMKYLMTWFSVGPPLASIWIPFPPLTSHVWAWTCCLTFYASIFLLKNQDNNSTYFLRLLWELRGSIYAKL